MSLKYKGTPQVLYSSKLESTGIYNPSENILRFKFKKAQSTSQKALVIHEATHAILDMYSVKTNIKYAETFAYVAQCQYIMIAEPTWGRVKGETEASDKKWKAAWELAAKLRLGGSVESSDFEAVADGVYTDPSYTQDCYQMADYHGI